MDKELNRLSEMALALAKGDGFDSVSLYCDWDGFIVFKASRQHKSDLSDLPEHLPLILIKDSKVRWANPNESSNITIFYEQPPR